jgi:hypothetical protein
MSMRQVKCLFIHTVLEYLKRNDATLLLKESLDFALKKH